MPEVPIMVETSACCLPEVFRAGVGEVGKAKGATMRAIRIKDDDDGEHYERRDKRLIADAMRRSGYMCSPMEAGILWNRYSESMAAGWMMLPDTDAEIVSCIERYFEVEEMEYE